MRGKPIYLPGMEMEGQTAKEIVGLPQLKVVGCHGPKKRPILLKEDWFYLGCRISDHSKDFLSCQVLLKSKSDHPSFFV